MQLNEAVAALPVADSVTTALAQFERDLTVESG
jgi:hypothetical protein